MDYECVSLTVRKKWKKLKFSQRRSDPFQIFRQLLIASRDEDREGEKS